jgi:endonuclease/exonuclease/phosphatase family metal-dependent hydrolase
MAPALRVMTYNIHSGRGADRKVDLGRIAAVIAGCAPDVVALQEVDVGRARSGGVDQAADLGARLGMDARFVAWVEDGGERYGIATLSRWPIEDSRSLRLPSRPGNEPRGALQVWLRWPGRDHRIEVVNTHLSIHGNDRGEQAAALTRAIGGGDVVVAGDLNCGARAGPYRTLCAQLRETTRRRTWPARLPLLQLDHLLYRGALRVVSAGVWTAAPARRASDHLPVFAELAPLEAA